MFRHDGPISQPGACDLKLDFDWNRSARPSSATVKAPSIEVAVPPPSTRPPTMSCDVDYFLLHYLEQGLHGLIQIKLQFFDQKK
jgi:hypothetical protein